MKQSENKNPTKLFFEMFSLKIKFLIPLIVISIISCKQNKQPPQTQNNQPQQAKAQKRWSENKQLPIWTRSIPDSGLITEAETYNDGMVKNVSHPTITIYSPEGKNTGVAVIVKEWT